MYNFLFLASVASEIKNFPIDYRTDEEIRENMSIEH